MIELGNVRNIAISSKPICDAPSSPIDTPQCEPHTVRFALEIALMRSWSCARERNEANVDANTLWPFDERPRDMEIMFCSAMKHSTNCLLVCTFNLTFSANVELLTSASSTRVLEFDCAILCKAKPYASLVDVS